MQKPLAQQRIFAFIMMMAPYFISPNKHKGTTTIIALLVPNVDAVMAKAIIAGS
jgi:hypothetical protein